jgi:hypothetical protein
VNLEEQQAHYRAVRERLGDVKKPKVVNIAPPVIEKPKQQLPPPPENIQVVYQKETPNPFIEISDEVKEALKWPPRDAILEMLEGTGVTLAQLKSRSREQKLVDLRHHACWILRTRFNWSMPKIGRFFNRDHTTALHGVERWQKIVDAQGGQNAGND